MRKSAPPPAAVLAAFGVAGAPVPLAGGQGSSWRVGDAVLKPVDAAPWQVAWQAELLAGLAELPGRDAPDTQPGRNAPDGQPGRDDLRVAAPLRTRSGQWTAHGWTASRHEPGRHLPGRWLDVIAVGQRFHAALRDVPEPPLLAARTDRWAVGDRVAWGEQPWTGLPLGDAARRHLPRLTAALRPVAGRSQLVHGDLTGNVLFDDDLPPLVLDLSPYWRPPAFASAVVLADALVSGADEAALAPVLRQPGLPQHLLRALVFRIVSDGPCDDDRYAAAVDLALRLAR